MRARVTAIKAHRFEVLWLALALALAALQQLPQVLPAPAAVPEAARREAICGVSLHRTSFFVPHCCTAESLRKS